MRRDFRLYLDDILEAIHQIRTYMADAKIPQQGTMFDNGSKPQDEMPARKKAAEWKKGSCRALGQTTETVWQRFFRHKFALFQIVLSDLRRAQWPLFIGNSEWYLG